MKDWTATKDKTPQFPSYVTMRNLSNRYDKYGFFMDGVWYDKQLNQLDFIPDFWAFTTIGMAFKPIPMHLFNEKGIRNPQMHDK